MEFQEVMCDRFQHVIEEATGAWFGSMSGNQQDSDMICEVFVLAPTELLGDSETWPSSILPAPAERYTVRAEGVTPGATRAVSPDPRIALRAIGVAHASHRSSVTALPL